MPFASRTLFKAHALTANTVLTLDGTCQVEAIKSDRHQGRALSEFSTNPLKRFNV